VSPLEKAGKKAVTPAEVERAAVRELVRAARARGDDLTGPEGLLKMITKTVIESALDEEMAEHVGYDKHAVEGRNRGNSRNGRRTKTVLTDNAGPVEVVVPRDRDGTFEPVIVKKRQRRLSEVDTVVLSLYAKGLTTGEISAHFAEVYGASVSKDTVSRITDRVVEDMQALGRAFEGEGDGFVGVPAVDVVGEGGDGAQCHGGSPWAELSIGAGVSTSDPRAGLCSVDITRGDFTFGDGPRRVVTMTPQGEALARGGVALPRDAGSRRKGARTRRRRPGRPRNTGRRARLRSGNTIVSLAS
jgi:hypothetical protein